MTSLAIVRSRLSAKLGRLPLEGIAFALVLLTALGAALVAFRAPAESGRESSATVTLSSAKAAALVAATGATADVRAVGEEARLINASLPFSNAPLQSAQPFAVGNDGLDQRRALLCLTQAVYYEAGFEPMQGRRAVAQVVLNRMRHPAFPKSVCGVVYQGSKSPVCQFSFVCDGSLYRAPAAAAWRDAQEIARAALAGYVESSVGSATHYHADYVAPRWAPMLTKLAKLGAHIFYRWPGAWGQRAAFTGRYIGEPQDPLALRPPVRPQQSVDPVEIEQVIAAGPVTDGTVLKRAPTDVGGLLDVSKGWTLNIPAPDDVATATARALAEQRAKNPAAPVASTAAPIAASN